VRWKLGVAISLPGSCWQRDNPRFCRSIAFAAAGHMGTSLFTSGIKVTSAPKNWQVGKKKMDFTGRTM
jgi:hypothetical protein